MSGNKMALDALTAALDAMEHMANTLDNMDAVDEDEDAQHDAAFEAVRAAIAALQAEEVERLAAQAAPTKISEFPEDYDGLAHLYIQACEERDHLRAVLAAQPSQAPVVQAGEYPPLPEELFSEFWGCVAVWDLSAEGEEAGAEAIRIENVVKGLMRAYVDADRASSGATTQAVRMLTKEELTDLIASTVAALTKGQQ